MKSTPSLFTCIALLALAAAPGRLPAQTATADNATLSSGLGPDGGRIVVEAHGVQPKAPLFFSATAQNSVHLGPEEVTGEIKLKLHVLQGHPEVLTLGLGGDGEITDASGGGLRDWAVRQGAGAQAGKRFLDLRPTLEPGKPEPKDLEITIHTRLAKPSIPGTLGILLVMPGEAAGFSSVVKLEADPSIDLRVTDAAGMLPFGDEDTGRAPPQFYATGDGKIQVALARRGAAVADAELTAVALQGKLDEAGGSVDFHLQGQARAGKPGTRLRLLSGRAGLSGSASGDGWHAELVQTDGAPAYDLVFDRAGDFAFGLDFAAAIENHDDWRSLDFRMPAGAVVPLSLEGLGQGVTFNPADPVVPAPAAPGWRGFLPANGSAVLSWKQSRAAAEGALFFTGNEEADVRVGAGLLRQTSRITLRVLQGKMTAIQLRLDGPGEVLGVEGPNVVGWKVLPAGNQRTLDVQISQPVEHEETLTIQTQSALGAFPVRAEPVRWTPVGAVRHSGYVRVANNGAVRLEITAAQGLMQLAPGQFPGAGVDGARQVFVYRFASADYSYRVLATQILPEVNVSQVTLYELGETDRAVTSDLELDIREAPLREWSLTIPADYAVVTVTGNDVADYVAETTATGGMRNLKILFGRAVDGRQLVHLRLEKNQPAAAGDWQIPPLGFPDAKSVRGNIGIVSVPGYRIAPLHTDKLVELPLSYFPQQVQGLQQAYRLHEPGWTAALRIEALSQSVQADVFHLYSVKEGIVYGSVLLNYFVVGAPANEWRIQVPKSVGNIDVVGQGVQRDWRREGDEIIVSLHEPVLGPATLLVTFEQPMSARGGSIAPGEVRPLGVQAERGFIQVVSPLQVKFQVQKAEGLLKLDPLELPPEFRLLSTSPSLAIYQYTARPFQLAMDIDWYAPAETVDQVVDFAKLSSHVSRDGQVVTDAHFFVKTRGRKDLRMILPEGVKLWEARADHEVVNARADGNQTLIPLPPRTNPNEPVEVTLRLGQVSPRASRPVLAAPVMLVPTVISEWVLRADPGRLLVPKGGAAELRAPNLTETGFEWLHARAGRAVFALFILIAASGLLLRGGPPWKNLGGLVLGAIALVLAAMLCLSAISERRINSATLSYATAVIPAGETVTIQVGNFTPWHAMISWWGAAAALLGAAILALAVVRVLWGEGRATFNGIAGAVLLSAGLLAQRGGAIFFFASIAAALFFAVLIPGFRRWFATLRLRGGTSSPAGGAAAATALLAAMLSLGLLLASSPAAWARPHGPASSLEEGAKPAESMVQSWKIQKQRLTGEIDLTVRGVVGDSFLLLKDPAVLTDFKSDGLRVTKVERGGQTAYFVTPLRDGLLAAHAKFEMPAPEFGKGISLPTGSAAIQRIAIQLDEGGWEVTSPMAVQALPLAGLAPGQSGATLVLGPSGSPTINFNPKRRDVTAEATQFFAELANLYIPGPGVVNGSHHVTIRPAQGRVSELEFTVPKGFTVGEVHEGPVGEWRFDPGTRKLRVAIEPAQTEPFKLTVETQLGTGELPVNIALEPLKITGASAVVGTLALAFGTDAQPEEIKPTGLSPANLEDFDPALIGGQPIATVQQVYRYSGDDGLLTLKVAPVAPEVRVTAKQVLSLGDDRLVVAADLNVAITRAGVFKLSFVLPEGLEVESLSGPALSQWTEGDEAGQHVITMHLTGRTMGDQNFSLTLSGAAPRAQAAWVVPRLAIREATRQTGNILLVPEKGLRLRDAGRVNASQLDPRDAGGMQPGTLAFRLLQQDWSLKIAIEALDPWVTVQALQEITMREGQTLTRLCMRYRIENAAVKQLRVTLPGLSEEQIRTVRATGPAVKDMIQVTGSAPDLWEIHFQRGIAGETDVQIEFQGQTAREQDKESIQNPGFGNAQVTLFVAIRGGGRLELEANDIPRGWERLDWSAVPGYLQDRGDRSVPAFCFRVAEPERPLAVTIHRHDVADALKLRVIQGELTTLFSPRGPFLTSAELRVEVVEKTTMRIRLPEKAQLFNTFVNGESVPVVREEDAYLFNVSPNGDQDHTAAIRLVYMVPQMQRGPIRLDGPSLGVPLENVSWRVIMPSGMEMRDYQGDLRLKETESAGLFGMADYQSSVVSKRAEDSRSATALLERADALLQQGNQQEAGQALDRAAKANGLDEASNEDARVQLRTLKTQQAILGLNTRRQKLYLDNRVDAQKNGQLEQAAIMNPFMQGKVNFDPQQFDQLLQGNTVEENTALRGIAGRLVDQQLAAEPAPSAIDVTLPERGQVLTFIRSLQVDGNAPLKLELELGEVHRAGAGYVFLLLLAIGVAAGLVFPRRSEAEIV